jgi:hypothetical protein
MKKIAGAMLALLFVLPVGMSVIATAQDKPMSDKSMSDKPMSHMPPKVLVAMREYTKPGKVGMQHEKTESLFVQAMMRAKWPTHYLAMESLTGKSRALFFTGYDSFDAWGKDTLAGQKNPSFSAAIDHASAVDGELLDETDETVLMFREDYSLRPEVDVAHTRYWDISSWQVKPGHDADWEEIVKLVKAAYDRIPDAHWAAYQAVYGFPNTTYIVFTPLKSLEEVDKSFASGKDFARAMGEDGMKKLDELSGKAIEASQSNLFGVNPHMSYPSDEWVKGDPDFWKPNAATSATKPAKKKAESQ